MPGGSSGQPARPEPRKFAAGSATRRVERRGQAETDPIKKARIAQFLKEYWSVKKGNSQMRQNGALKTVGDIAKTIGEDRRTTQRLMKLNDLIPELQSLVSAGKLGTTAAEQLAYLTEEEQRALVEVIGENERKKGVSDPLMFTVFLFHQQASECR